MFYEISVERGRCSFLMEGLTSVCGEVHCFAMGRLSFAGGLGGAVMIEYMKGGFEK